jgi:hypothetical protein
MRSMVEGAFLTPKNPSTALRAVPLPGKCRGGFSPPDPRQLPFRCPLLFYVTL